MKRFTLVFLALLASPDAVAVQAQGAKILRSANT